MIPPRLQLTGELATASVPGIGSAPIPRLQLAGAVGSRRPGDRRRAVLILAVAFACLVAIGWLDGWRSHVMTTASMGRTAPVGALVISRPVSVGSIRVGELVVFHPPCEPGETFVHRVVAILHDGDGPAFSTRGDINGSADPWTVRAANLTGRAEVVIPVVGFLVEMLPGILIALFVILLLTASMQADRRRAARTVLASLAGGALLFYYRPLVRASLIGQTVTGGRGTASVVPTGVLPVRVSAVGGSHTDLVPGQVGVVRVGHVPAGHLFRMTVHLHLSGWWWLVLIAWGLPLLVGVWSTRDAQADSAEPVTGVLS